VHYAKGINWYKAHFALNIYKKLEELKRQKKTLTFDGTPNYFDAPLAAERLANTYPKSKLILLLRNPVERAWSNYRMACRFGFEKLSFEEALKLEQARLDAEAGKAHTSNYHNYVYQRLTYKRRGIYIHFLKNWLDRFPNKQMLILKSEDLFMQPHETYNRVTDFLELERDGRSQFPIYNEGERSMEMNSATRLELAKFYGPYNQQLYKYLGVDYGWK
jgi:hypothetical protein